MDPKVLDWGDVVIQNSVPTNILIIDELGYLEFEKKMGWISAFKILDEGDYKNAIVVVRASLLGKALEKFENAVVIAVKNPTQIKEHTSFLVSQITGNLNQIKSGDPKSNRNIEGFFFSSHGNGDDQIT